MIRLVLVLALTVMAASARAETVKVISGEHATFTRLVLELPNAAEWQLGRTTAGYEFASVAGAQPRYDLTTVWDKIPKARLQAIFADPDTGRLRLTLTCNCHAFPFEYQPGTVVIDLRDGPAPAGSIFESPLDAQMSASVRIAAASPPDAASGKAPVGYDWLAGVVPSPKTATRPVLAMPLPTGSASLAPLRDALLEEISRGAAEGIVEIAGPIPRPVPAPVPGPLEGASDAPLPWTRIAIGEMPGVVAGADRLSAAEMLPDGAACIPDADLAIADWATAEPGAVQLADARAGLMQEFDIPDPEAVRHAIRVHLGLGFGAEALQYINFLEAPGDEEMALYATIAHVIDGEGDPSSPVARMLGCDTVAALWAVLLHDRLPSGAPVNTGAVLRGFAALPPHLRRLFGPDLVERFLQRGDTEAARMLRDATARAPDVTAQDVDLLDAQMTLADGHPEDAARLAQDALNGGAAAGMDAVITLVEAQLAKAEPITPEVLAAVQSYQLEAEGTASDLAMRRALALALALSGQPTEALKVAQTLPETLVDVWRAVSLRATDAELIAVAVLPETAEIPVVTEEVALRLAERLTDLGFAEAALVWLDQSATASPALRLAAARAELARSAAGAAIALLQGQTGPEAEAVRAEALVRLGKFDPAAESWRAAGEEAQAARLAVWRRDWSGLAKAGAAPWKDAAGLAVSAASADGGLLARGAALVDESAAARQTIAALLAAVPAPAAGP